MQCLSLKENFIFSSNIKLTKHKENSEEAGEAQESILLTTINGLYIFKNESNKNDKNDEFLENKLLLKCKHEDIYVEKFINENELMYAIGCKRKDDDYKFTIKLEHPHFSKEYIKILVLFEAWKTAIKYNYKEYKTSINKDDKDDKDDKEKKNIETGTRELPEKFYLFQMIDSYIQNNFVFQIDDIIFDLHRKDQDFVECFFNVITIFQNIAVNLEITDQNSSIFQYLFQSYINNNISNTNIKHSLINLSLKSIYLKDSYAERILPSLIFYSPYLKTLDLSHNKLTNKIFQILYKKGFLNVHLNTLNLSYNELTSDNLSKYIFQITKEFLRINLFDLRGNLIDNRFLNNFNHKAYEELRNSIQEKLSGNNLTNNYPKESITFDLRETNINLDKTSFRLYLKKKRDLSNHLEIKNNFNDGYENKIFGLENIIFIFDLYFFKKNYYKYNSCSRSKIRLNVDVKNYQLKKSTEDEPKEMEKIKRTNNWFYTGYYEKEDEEIEAKKEAKSNDNNNDKKKNKNDESKGKKKDEEKNKNKNDEGINPRKNKKASSLKNSKIKTSNNKKSMENSSKPQENEGDSIFPEPVKAIMEENSEEKNSKDDIDEVNEKSKVKIEINQKDLNNDNIKEEDNENEKENENNKINNNINESNNSPKKEENQINLEDDKDQEKQADNSNNNNNIKQNDPSGDEKISQENQINNLQKKPTDYRTIETEIITKTDDEFSSGEENKKIINNDKKKEIIKPKEKVEKSSKKKKKKKKEAKNRSTIYEKNIDMDKIKNAKKYHELDLYRELFKFFFLCDYFFDPVLNSFATKMPKEIKRDKKYMSIKNELKRYKDLKKFIDSTKNPQLIKKNKSEDDKIFNNELYINDAKQMYYDYINLMRIKTSQTERRLTTRHLLVSLFKNITKNSVNILKDEKKFNPNGLIEHMGFFYLYLASPHDYKIKIPKTTLNKLISRIKLESLLCLKEKSHNSLGTLSKIVSGLGISIKTQIKTVFNQLTEKAKLILEGLVKVLNFEGYNKVENMKGFLFETGNFLDIFLEKADSINLSNDLVILCKYVQYWRNNYIRNLIYNLLREISKKEGATRGCDMTEEFAKANEDYKNVPIKNMGLTKDINYPEFAQHPSNVDYLYFSEKNSTEFDKDLKNITRYIKADQTYFKRNLYDRINFLFCSSSRNHKSKKSTYSLHRGNSFLKVMRILFRYNNNLDYKKLELKFKNKVQDFFIESSLNTYNLNSSLIYNCKIFNNMIFDKKTNSLGRNSYINDTYIDITDSLSKIAIEESYLRVIDFPDDNNLESEITRRDKKKIRLLLHSNNYNEPETLLDLSLDKKINEEQINLFKETTKNFNSKCQEQLSNLDAMSNPLFITIVQNYIKYFLIIKEKFKNDRKLWEYQNLECFYQIYRFANINNFSNKKEKNEIDYPFVLLTIMCFYFEFSVPMVKRVKSFAYYLFSNLSHRKNCKTIIRALNNPFRYDWIMSTLEIYRKLDNSELSLSVYYPSNDGSFKEDYLITETTTASELMKDIFENGKVLKDSKEKDFYWLYFTNNDEPWKYQYINHEQILVQLIAEEEQNELGENDILINIMNENNINDIKSENSKINDSNVEEKNEKMLENYCEQKTFKKMHFEVKRRIFTPNLFNGNIDPYNYFERELLFNQIKIIFYSSEIVDYTWSGIGEKIAMVCYFEQFAEKKRQLNLQRANELESRISSSRIVTKFHMNMNDIETLPIFDNNDLNSKEESFTNEHNLTYSKKDNMSFGLNSIGSAKNKITYKTYNLPKASVGSNNMDVIKEEDDDEFILNNSFHRNSILSSNKEEKKIVNTEDLDKEVLIPKNLNINGQPLKQVYNEIASKMHILSDPKKIFFELVKERPILMSNIYEVNNKQSTESFPEKFLISVNIDKVSFLHRTNYTKIFEFKYEEIVKCLILDNYILLLMVNVFKDEIDQRTEVVLKIESTENRFIMEDILSYSQLYLATKTKSKYVSIHNGCVTFLNGYKIMFDRLLPFRTEYSSPLEQNKKEIMKMKELLHNNELYKKYKEEKVKKKEEEIKESQKGKLDIKSIQTIQRYNDFDDEDDSEESQESVKVIPLNLNKNKKINNDKDINENKITNVDNKEENKEGENEEEKKEEEKEEEKEEIKEEEKMPEKTEEEIQKEMEMKKKMDENEQKRKEVDKVLSKALLDFQFDDDTENKEEEDEY